MMSREEWLYEATKTLDNTLFNGELHTDQSIFQIACGRTGSIRTLGETIYPYQGEDVSLDDFFPVTIHISCFIADPVEMLEVLAHECIHAFYGIRGHKKDFGHIAAKIGFEKPYSHHNPSARLTQICGEVYAKMKEQHGDFPGKPILLSKKEKKEGEKKQVLLFCPECGYEVKVDKKVFEKYNHQMPTCICGTEMAQDLDDK